MNDEHHTYLGEYQGGYRPGPLSLTGAQRFEHVAVLGTSGVGKSTLLRAIAVQDIARGDGLLYIDPHGDDAAALLDCIPPSRHNHVCFLQLADVEWPIALNVLECDHPDDRAAVADAVVSAVRDIWFDNMVAAPRMENVLRHAILALLHVPNSTIAQVPRLLTDDLYRRQVVPRVTNPVTRQFFDDRFDEWREAFRAEVVEPLLTRIDTVLSFPVMLNSLAQHQRTLRIDRAMQGRRIIICDLSRIPETAAHVMGALLLARVRAATLARARLSVEERRPFHVVVEEVQRYASHSLPSLLGEARKFKVSIAYSTQMLSSLTERTQAAVLGTTGTTVAFRLGPEDAAAIAPKFDDLHRPFNAASFNDLRLGEAFIKVGADDVRRVRCAPPAVGFGGAEAVRQQSRRHYARPRGDVEGWLEKSLSPIVVADEVHMTIGKPIRKSK